MTYDAWKLATPPEYEYLEKRPMREIPCQCSVWFKSRPCGWSAYVDDLVLVEVILPRRRSKRVSATSHYVYPHDGTRLLRVSRECAVRMLGEDLEWVEVVRGLGKLTVEEVYSILAVRGIAPADFWAHFVGRHKIDTDALRLACVRCAEEAASKP